MQTEGLHTYKPLCYSFKRADDIRPYNVFVGFGKDAESQKRNVEDVIPYGELEFPTKQETRPLQIIYFVSLDHR